MPGSTRDQILDAAEALFAAQGFSRTTIKQIGARAGFNTALLYYYFGDKERLYREVLQRFVTGLVARTMGGLEAGGTPAQRLRGFITAQSDALAANPQFPRLMVRELVDHDAAHAVEQVRLLAGTSFRRLCELIREGQSAGIFRLELDPRYAAISVISRVAYFSIARPAIRILLGSGPDGPTPETAREFGRHAADFALAALAVPDRPRRPARSRSRSP